MTPELYYLAATALLTAVIWLPYAVDFIIKGGLMNAIGPHEDVDGLARWAVRMKNAHANAVENLVIFAALIFVVQAAGVNNETTALAAMVFFWARVGHLLTHTFGIPWLRTVAFFAGFGCQLTLAMQVLL